MDNRNKFDNKFMSSYVPILMISKHFCSIQFHIFPS